MALKVFQFSISLATLFSGSFSAPLNRILEPFGPSFSSSVVEGPYDDFQTLVTKLDSSFKSLENPSRVTEYLEAFEPLITSYVNEKFHVDVRVQSKYNTFQDISHYYLQQFHNNIPIVNGLAALHVDSTQNIAYFTQSLELDISVGPKDLLTINNEIENIDIYNNQDYLSKQDAFEAFIAFLGFEEYDTELFESAPMSLKYLRTNDKGLRLVWDIELDLNVNWFNSQVDSENGNVLMLVDWVSHASFEVFPLGYNDPRDGPRKLVANPEHPLASPSGWNSFKSNNGKIVLNKDTQGNNVFAQDNPNGRNDWRKNHRFSSEEGIFSPNLNLTKEPTSYIDAAIVNLFYWNNIIHDLFYVYGFTEPAGNFQGNNFGRGGRGGDAVIANAQDGSGTNNANFATPPDGGQGRMRMYVWTQTKPNRDGDFESGIIVHEYAHGISTRLTGGPANSGCLGWGEAGGMGEGWGDWFATILRMNSNNTRHDNFGMGDYSAGGTGIRKYRYSTNNKTNPSTYAYVRLPGYWGVHAKGEVWAEILYEFFWDLVDIYGWEDDYFNVPLKTINIPNEEDNTEIPFITAVSYPKPGNKLALRLVVDGLKLQPCSPSFVDARDAILQADKIGTRGSNGCTIWKSFARRGLGVNAVSGGRENFDVPAECEE